MRFYAVAVPVMSMLINAYAMLLATKPLPFSASLFRASPLLIPALLRFSVALPYRSYRCYAKPSHLVACQSVTTPLLT